MQWDEKEGDERPRQESQVYWVVPWAVYGTFYDRSLIPAPWLAAESSALLFSQLFI
jgi:hypothetical protein